MAEYLTAEELNNLKEKLNYLETVKTKEISTLLRHAISFGDLSENAAYTEAKERQAFLQGEISKLREIISSAKIIEKKKSNKVQVGSEVTILLDGEINKIKIVSSVQTDPLKGNVSLKSPLGRAILGKSAGETVKVKIAANREISCKIINID